MNYTYLVLFFAYFAQCCRQNKKARSFEKIRLPAFKIVKIVCYDFFLATSLWGGSPNWRLYSLVNCETLS